MNKINVPLSAKSFFVYNHLQKNRNNILLLTHSEEEAVKCYQQLQFFSNNNPLLTEVILFPSLDTAPYDLISPEVKILSRRADILTSLSLPKAKSSLQIPKILVTAAGNLIKKIPPPEIFTQILSIKVGTQITLDNLIRFLTENNFHRSVSAVESGEFAVRGEIVDLVSGEQAYRINFNQNNIESIRLYDTDTQLSFNNIDNIDLFLTGEAVLNSSTIATFKDNFLKKFGVNYHKEPLYEAITRGQKFPGYENLLPLFYQRMSTILDFIGDYQIIYDNLAIQAILEYEYNYNNSYKARTDARTQTGKVNNFHYAIEPELLINSSKWAKEQLNSKNNILIEPDEVTDVDSRDGSRANSKTDSEADSQIKTLAEQFNFANNNDNKVEKILTLIKEHKSKIPVILCNSKSSIEYFKSIFASGSSEILTGKVINSLSEARKDYINLALVPLSYSFSTDSYIFLAAGGEAENKISTRTAKTNSKKLKSILMELDNIAQGDLVTHQNHGIGRFVKIETVTVTGIAHDCLKIIYAGDDILYLPVENINLIKKYGNNEANLDRLGSLAWQSRKAQLKKRINEIAAQLITLTAKRKIKKVAPVHFDSKSYDEFCQRFNYSETEDQLNSINDIRKDLEQEQLMDRLICGDVGFGKTEVAMRAAFMVACAVNNVQLQVALICPTTILAKQHYQTFIERFAGLPVKIVHFSRLVPPAQRKQIQEELKNGRINIVIGTHALLAENIHFANLKLLIIDEEQYFGVAQKEHLKKLKEGVHVLSLSATPIPRTFQMAMVGIKDLSLITTPPVDRLPVKTVITSFDPLIIREALVREKARGGRSFYVCPRIKDIHWVQKQLELTVPELSYKIAHGKIGTSIIDNIMNEFCAGRFDILLSTTIIGSGIDIPVANTIIIHRADMLGLSQLYQLKGRVGRSKVRGYAYLTLAAEKVKTHSYRRLEVIQNINSLGAGFTIANYDIDFRGFGNLIGAEQSGHIKEVGVELYQEMLENAISKLKEEQLAADKNCPQNDDGGSGVSRDFAPTINLPVAIFIPATYIEDSSLRLTIYRRVGELQTDAEIRDFTNEMIDRFGTLPVEFQNLLDIVKIKNRCFALKIISLDGGPKGFIIKFGEGDNVNNMVMSFITRYPADASIRPPNKLVLGRTLTKDNILDVAKNLLTELESISSHISS